MTTQNNTHQIRTLEDVQAELNSLGVPEIAAERVFEVNAEGKLVARLALWDLYLTFRSPALMEASLQH